MFSFLKKRAPRVHRAEINGERIEVLQKETLLHAALRHDIEFPHSCRVGGCSSCKCQLMEGTVKELTDLGYILDDDELDQGYILACQSTPTSDVRISVDLEAQRQRQTISGRIVSQQRLTHDITHLTVQANQPLQYRAGQYADLSLDAMPGWARSYSFSTPSQPDGKLHFFVRKVPGGVFSTRINDEDLRGRTMTVDGPAGDFWLRRSRAPMVMIAGGSGLAPILAILKEGLEGQNDRPVTLLFGARSQRDLYALDDIRELQRQWSAPFEFFPVLSQEPEKSDWWGARGLVTEMIPDLPLQGSEAYLCGPPGMIDSAEEVLIEGGVDRGDIHADRFVTVWDAMTTVEANYAEPERT